MPEVIGAHRENSVGLGAARGGGAWLGRVRMIQPFPEQPPRPPGGKEICSELSTSVSSHCSGQTPAPWRKRRLQRQAGSVHGNVCPHLAPSSQVQRLFCVQAPPTVSGGAPLPLSLLANLFPFSPQVWRPSTLLQNPGRQRSNRFSWVLSLSLFYRLGS